MRSQEEILDLLAAGRGEVERRLGIKIRNGQAIDAYRKTLVWVLKEGDR